MGEIIDMLALRNVNEEFYYSGCFETEYGYLPSYYNSISKNLLIFDTTDCDDITVESICNATVSKGAYEYLTNVLNTCENTLIMWSQVEGTTSDYTIYYDVDTESVINDEVELEEILSNLNYKGCINFKFREVKNKNITKIQFN